MNLVLVGYAASQVHDKSIPLGDSGMMLRGVQRRPVVGYLSYLEAMR